MPLLFLLAFGLGGVANAIAPSPTLSPAGRRILEANRGTIEQNIRDLAENISTSSTNAAVLQTEIDDLLKLRKENESLQQDYKSQLEKARREGIRNDKSITTIDAEKKAASPSSNDADITKLETKRAARLQWRTETNQKTEKLKELLRGIEDNLAYIGTRAAYLKGQQKSWTERQHGFEQQLKLMQQKKAELTELSSKTLTDSKK